MKYALIGGLAAIGATLPGTMAAQSNQSVPPNVGVADRPRPAFDPIGARLGGVFVYPRVDAGVSATDNVLAVENERDGDLFATLRPSVQVKSDWSRHRLVADAYFSRNAHLDKGREDVSQYGVDVDGTYDVSRQTAVRFTGDAEHLALDRTAYGNVVEARSPIRYDRFRGGVEMGHEFNRLSVTGSSSLLRADFQDAFSYDGDRIDQDYRDYTSVAVVAGARYRFGAGPSLIGRVGVDRNRYDEDTAVGDRDSFGLKAEGGFAFELSSLLYGEVRAGYIRRNYRNPLFNDASGLSFGANLLWNVTPLTTVHVRADRDFSESRSPAAASNLITQGEVGVDHELLRYVILGASARYALINPVGNVNNNEEYAAGLNARYLFDRQVQLIGGYRFIKRAGVGLNRPFTSNALSLTLRYTR